MGRALGLCQEMLIDKSRVGFAIQRWQMRMKDQISTYSLHPKFSQIAKEKPIDRWFDFDDLRIPQDCFY
jgi:hypothetical protein